MTRLLLSRTGEDEADILEDTPQMGLALGGVKLEVARRIVACVNACADIPTESLVSMNWQLAPVAGAKPVDVAALILKLGEYREALAKIAARPLAKEIESAYELAAKHNNSVRDAQEALE